MDKKLIELDQEEYLKQFPLHKERPEALSIRERALSQAIEIRKFEIELYWKRATYFWVFIGAAFVAYASFSKEFESQSETLVWISCVGLVFSVAWHCVNKGSKFWQENWENHVELLEDKIHGPLYKTITKRPPRSRFVVQQALEDLLVAPVSFSVSKINQIVSTYIALVWLFLLVRNVFPIDRCAEPDWWKIIPIVVSLGTCCSFWIAGKSHLKEHTPYASKRAAEIQSPT